MLAKHHLVPDPHLLYRLHNDKLQSPHISGCRWNSLWGCYRLKKPSRTSSTWLHEGRRQDNVAVALHFPQGLQATASLGDAAGIEEFVVLADLIRKLCSVHTVVAIKH
jgi:hypothetical protein